MQTDHTMSKMPGIAGSDATVSMETSAFASVTASDAAPERIGAWLIERRIGAGAMGEVYLAVRGEQRAALKLVARDRVQDDSFLQRFQREIAVLAKFDHPHVERALDGGEHDGQPWLAMEFVDGPDVESVLKQNQNAPFAEMEVLQFAIQLARGLEHVHSQAGLIHRDIKPANVLIARAPGGDPRRLLNPGDIAKLIDFGLAKPTEQAEGMGLTMTGMIMGTPNYIAPEQVACERTLTLHVDMYSLGASMFHLLTGRLPFPTGSAASVMVAHLNQPPPDPGQVLPTLTPLTRKLVLTTMAKRAADRYTDWGAFIVACEKALAAAPPSSGGTSRIFKPQKPTTVVLRRAESSQQVVANIKPEAPAVVPGSVGSGSAALRAAVTSRIAKPPSGQYARSSTVRTERAPRPDARASAVHTWSGRLETAGTTGGSILPWLALGLARLLAVAVVVWAFIA